MFKSVRTDRISQAIIDQIKEAIFQKKLTIGDKLPSERQLMEQFETSRVTVREALRTLEYSGILEIKRGNQGGAFVRDPNIMLGQGHTAAGGGVAILVEAVRQLMGKAGERQVNGAEIAVETSMGGTFMDSHVVVLGRVLP